MIYETMMAYKLISAVMDAEKDLVDILHTLRPVGLGKGQPAVVVTFRATAAFTL